MGGVSSVYIRPVAPTTSPNDQPVVSDVGNQLVRWRLQENDPAGRTAGVLEMTIVSEDREAEMGKTIQFLAEENVRLRQMNEALKIQLGDGADLVQPDLFEESDVEKIERLEKTLAVEREEKWAAIANAESRRVNLINCQKLLNIEEETRRTVEKELEEVRAQCNGERLKTSADVQAAVARHPDLGDDLKTFRNQMQQLREARHRAISAKSDELNKLRTDLANERALRERLERKFGQTDAASREMEPLETDSIQLRNENVHLNENLIRVKFELSQLSAKCLQLVNDLSEAHRKNERLGRDFSELEKENERIRQNSRENHQELPDGFQTEKEEMVKQIVALKDIVRISRQMLDIRQNQVDDLKAKLNVIEETMSKNVTTDGGKLKAEYESQLANIKTLKELYEERVNLMEAERSKLLDKIASDARAMEDLKGELSDLSIKYGMAAEEADQERQKNLGLDAELSACVAQSESWHRELTCINSLLTQMLLGPNPETPEHLDRLAELLQQNHELIAQITNCEDCNDVAAALPKLLLDLITQIEDREKVNMMEVAGSMTDSTDTISEQSGALPIVSYKNAKVFKEPEIVNPDEGILDFVMPVNKINPAVQEIVTNLPKVWKVLTELLSHHSLVERQSGEPTGRERPCYKRIETPNGPRSVISVSNTFIRLKELILEKKSLTQEVCRLRHLNSHLETRLDDQEKRLLSVQSELHKTWGVVGRMRAQHQQLHNHEKILRYELQEKRIMLSELREELEHCKDKCERARRKNNESEAECRKLRKEFAARKFQNLGVDVSRDSGESGFSDDGDRSSTPSPVDFRTRTEPDVKSSPAGNYSTVEEVPFNENVDLLEEMTATTTQWAQIVEEVGNTEEAIPVGSFGLDEELRVNIAPLEVALTPVEEEPPEIVAVAVVDGHDEDEEAVADEQERARAARALRLQRLEEQCALLVRKVDITTHKSNFLSNRLEELHDHYGGGSSTAEAQAVTDETKPPPTPPPLPPDPREMSVEERLAARAERLRRMEEQCSSLYGKVSNTVNRGNELSAKLTEIHEGCVSSENRAAAAAVAADAAAGTSTACGPEEVPETDPKSDENQNQ